MISYNTEPFGEFWDDAEHLLHEHYLEIAQYLDIPLAPNYEGYRQLELDGKLKVYTVRYEGKLIGYGVFMIAFSLKYPSSLQAIQDVLYLAPEYRGESNGYTLIEYCDNALKELGVQVVYQHAKKKHPQLGRLLQSVGYELTDELYARRLDNGD